MTTPRANEISTRVTDALGIRYPIVQGGLARIAKAQLAAAVSNAGGFGQLAMGGMASPDLLRDEIRKVKSVCDKPFGVNFPIGHIKIDPFLDVALEEGVSAVSFTGGNPWPFMARVKATATKIIILVAGPEQARKAEDAGADLIATVGYEGGGHLGRTDLTTIVGVPLVCKAVRVPVIAGGGISDGDGLVAALALGADGVEIGTRFVAVREASAHDKYKEFIVGANDAATAVISRSLGTPGRVLANAWSRKIIDAESSGASRDEVLSLVGAAANERGVIQGDIETSVLWAGQAVALIHDIPSAADVIERMIQEARSRIRELNGLIRPNIKP